MLIPITRKKFEELVPRTATADQYRHYWGKFQDILQRVLISVASVVVVLILAYFSDDQFQIIFAFLGSATGLYWLWQPVYHATRQNLEFRKYKYSGFFRGEVVDLFITEELVGQEETVNKQGDLVVIENRERRINLEIEDDTGFVTTVQAPLQKAHRSIRRGDIAEMLVLSNRPDLSRIMQISDVYVSDSDVWVSDYPYVRKDIFLEVSRRLNQPPDAYSQDDRDRADRYYPDQRDEPRRNGPRRPNRPPAPEKGAIEKRRRNQEDW